MPVSVRANPAMHSTTRIDLLRHGVCAGGNIFRGRCDVALAPDGLAQMQRVADQCREWSVIVTSPLQRCAQFAMALAQSRAVECLEDERLREMDFGDWEGRDIAAVWRDDQARVQAWTQDPSASDPPNGESLSSVARRITACLDDLLRDYRGQHLLLVTHGGVMRVAVGQVLGMPLSHLNRLDVPYACLSTLMVYGNGTAQITQISGHNCGAGLAGLAPVPSLPQSHDAAG